MGSATITDQQPVVFIVDDDEAVVRALARMLRVEGFETRTWTSVFDFFNEHEPEVPGCLIADVLMPKMSGIDLQRTLRRGGSARPIIFITGHGDIPTTVQVMKAGAVSLLTKPVRRLQLVAAVQEALNEDAARRALEGERRIIRNKVESLTPREGQVLRLVATGLLNKQIAAQLGTSEKTIKVHRGRLMRKMQVRSAAALVGLLARLGPNEQWDADLANRALRAHPALRPSHATLSPPQRPRSTALAELPLIQSIDAIAAERRAVALWSEYPGPI